MFFIGFFLAFFFNFMASLSNKKYRRLFIQVIVLIICAIVITILINHNDTRNKVLETAIKPLSSSRNIGLISDLHTITCAVIPILGEICLNKYSENSLINKDLLQNKYKYKNSYKKWLQFSLTKYIIIKRVNDVDDLILEGVHTKVPEEKEYKKLTILNQTLYLTYYEETGKDLTTGGYTNIDLLFGKGAVEARTSYNIVEDIVIRSNKGGVEMYMTLQNFNNSESKDETTVDKSIFHLEEETLSNFKIMQLADLHYAIGPGVCRDPFPDQNFDDGCEADTITNSFVNNLLDIEKPDFVVFSGDQIMGDLCTEDSESCLLKAVKPLVDRNITYTFIWGNHDDEGSLNREKISQFASTLPFSYYSHEKMKNADYFGYGNNIIQFANKDNEVLMKLFFLDSHKYSQKPKVFPGYDWIKEEQWDYVTTMNGKSSDTLNAAFYHIPLPEYKYDTLSIFNGDLKEGITSPKYDYGTVKTFFTENNIVFGSCGHDHVNDFCGSIDNTWLCYGGATGMGGYAGYGGYERRVRFFDIDLTQSQVQTYKIGMSNEKKKIDLFTLF